ncbi:nucleolin-like [Antennarius striatus]|uniref:nucleolin-like n=1 Tax=Antennarius striatus TaxID=241820 RepID=UPI0035AE697A
MEIAEEDSINADKQMETGTQIEHNVSKEEAEPTGRTEVNREENQTPHESPADIVVGQSETSLSVTVTWEKKNEEKERTESNGAEKTAVKKKKTVKRKRKARPTEDPSPSKKTKLINDGFCLYVGNLNKSKTFEEVKEALGKYLMTQSLLFQDIRLDRSRKYAYVDLASALDLTKALTLNGELVLDQPMKIGKANVRSVDEIKARAEEKKAAKDARCLFVKNVPYNATKQEVLEIFSEAVAVRFPDRAEKPDKGIAFVEFKDEVTAKKAQKEKQEAQMRGRVLVVDFAGESKGRKVTKATNKTTSAESPAASPNKTLFVGNLSHKVNKENLKKVFKTAVSISMPQGKGRSQRFAFVDFASVEDAEKALRSSQKCKIHNRELRVQFGERPGKNKVLSKTLVVMGLAQKTSADTLHNAFQGALSARVITDRKTGLSKGFGFVEFQSDEVCKAVKEAMEDCEIEDSKVTVDYAKSNVENTPEKQTRELLEVEEVELGAE